MQPRTKNLIAFSIIPQVLLVKLLSFFPEFVETFYSNGLYIWISKAMRFVFGWVPFSVGDFIYTLASIYVLRWLYVNRSRFLKDTKSWFRDILIAISFLYFSFHLLWGMNYYRMPLHESLGLDYKYTTEELSDVIDELTDISNNLHARLSPNDTLKITMPFEKSELLDKSPQGYSKVVTEFPQLNPHPVSVKSSLYSLALTYMGFSGYLNPFTNEAQIDGLIPLHKYPSTICHELAHQIGYAAENEANFVGFLAATHHEDAYYQYSGYIFALKYCLIDMMRRDPDLFEEKKENIYQGILKNYDEEQKFWESYQNPLEPLFKSTFNTFLKANSQDKGIESYSYVVALLVNHLK